MKHAFILALIVMALAARLMPHPDNFTPVLAVALFSGAMLGGRLAFVVPLAAMFVSDVALGYAFDWTSLVVYACFLACVGLGQWLGGNRTLSRTAGAALGGSVLFYVATNFAVWLTGGLYPLTLEGLIECYWMAIPFFRNSLAGDLFWTGALFGVFELASMQFRALQQPSRPN